MATTDTAPRHHCPTCGIRTHMARLGMELKNDDVHYGTCIKCSPKSVPPSVLKEWKERNPGVATRDPVASPEPSPKAASPKPASPKKDASPKDAAPKRPAPPVPAGQERSAWDLSEKAPEDLPNHHCDKCGLRTHRTLGFEVKNDECHYGTCIGCYPDKVPPSVNHAYQEKLDSASEKHHFCEVCGKRTHSPVQGSELKTDDVYYGTCIKCNLNDIPPPVREAWKKRQKKKEKSAKKLGVASDEAQGAVTATTVLAGEKERRDKARKEGLCPTCGIRTYEVSRFNRQPIKNDEVYYGTCIKCNLEKKPAVIPISVANAYKEEHKDELDAAAMRENPAEDVEDKDPVPAAAVAAGAAAAAGIGGTAAVAASADKEELPTTTKAPTTQTSAAPPPVVPEVTSSDDGLGTAAAVGLGAAAVGAGAAAVAATSSKKDDDDEPKEPTKNKDVAFDDSPPAVAATSAGVAAAAGSAMDDKESPIVVSPGKPSAASPDSKGGFLSRTFDIPPEVSAWMERSLSRDDTSAVVLAAASGKPLSHFMKSKKKRKSSRSRKSTHRRETDTSGEAAQLRAEMQKMRSEMKELMQQVDTTTEPESDV